MLSLSVEEVIARMEKFEQERMKKREEMERLTRYLLTYDSESLGDAVKCYISQEDDPAALSDPAFEAFGIISKIQVLELEC